MVKIGRWAVSESRCAFRFSKMLSTHWSSASRCGGCQSRRAAACLSMTGISHHRRQQRESSKNDLDFADIECFWRQASSPVS